MDVICNCGDLTVQRTAWTDANAGRRFFGCARGAGGCGYFRWMDPPLTARGRAVIIGLLRRVRELEENRMQEIQGMKAADIEEIRTMKVKKQYGVPWGSLFIVFIVLVVVYLMGGNDQ